MKSSSIHIGLLGCGTVGAALVHLLTEQRDSVKHRTGLDLSIEAIVVNDINKESSIPLPNEVLTTDASSVIGNPEINLIVEVMGGIEPARELILGALNSGQPVVTANKELLAQHGAELYAAAEKSGVDLLFEAAVAGGIPVVRPLRESLSGEPITRIRGIINGTTNFILTRMTQDGVSFDEALLEAQELVYAELDSTYDVEGYDAGAKIAILATLAFGADVTSEDVQHEGISGITVEDIKFADRLGHCIKLVAVAEQIINQEGKSEIGVRVYPALIPFDHPLAAVNGSFNAVFVEGDAVGELMFYGPGAGGRPTASAVFGDVIDASGNLQRSHGSLIGALDRPLICPPESFESSFYLNLKVEDQPGVLARVAEVFENHGVSIQSMEQEGMASEARLTFITHSVHEKDLLHTLESLKSLDVVSNVDSVLRVVGD